jgi:hypothetical protein
MLMSKSQLHPVMNAAAAGGNKMATCVEFNEVLQTGRIDSKIEQLRRGSQE